MSLSIASAAYAALSCVMLLCSIALRREAVFRTGFAIFASWLACTGIVLWLNDPAPWPWFTLFDTIACIIVTMRPAGKVQSAVGGIFVAEVFCHFIYGVSVDPNTDYYLNSLTALSDVQLALYGAWLGGGSIVRLARLASRLWLRSTAHLPEPPPVPRVG